MRTLVAVILALTVLLAGCSALTDSPTSTSTPTPTESPGAGELLAPGITDAGITNPVALLRAHQDELLADGFVVTQTVTTAYGDAASARVSLVTTVGPGGELALQSGTSVGTDGNGSDRVISNDVWLNTTAQISRHVESGSTTYDVTERLYPPESLVWFGAVQRDVQFAADEFEVTGIEEIDGVRYVSLAVSYDRVGDDGVDDTEGTLRVDERGVIHHAEMRVTYDEGTTYETTYEVREVGGVSPTAPDWLDAVSQSAALDVGLDVLGFTATSIELGHTHGDAVPAGSIVSVISNGSLHETTLESAFGDGTRYLWLAPDGSLRSTSTPPPSSAGEFDTEVTVTVHAPDGGELFATSIGRR